MLNIIQGDCFKIMQGVPDGSVDMILTDPPYALSQGTGGGMMGKNGREFMKEIHKAEISASFNIPYFLDIALNKFKTKQHCCMVLFCSKAQILTYLNWVEDKKLQYGIGIWHKTNPPPLCNNKYLGDIEFFLYIKGNKSRIRGCYESKSLVYTSKINTKDKRLYKHPTIKPLDLIQKFLVNHSSEGDTILDPFMGSGTTGVACVTAKRDFIGIELDRKYYETAKNRIADAICEGLV